MFKILALETRRLLQERLAALALVMMVLACALAFVGGRSLLASQVEGRASAEAAAAQQAASFRDALRNRADPADALGRIGRLGLPAIAPVAPLTDFTAGVAPYGDYAVSVTATSRDEALFKRSELADPELLARGTLDLGFVVIWVMPLVLIGLGYGLFTADRDSGAARLILAQAGDPVLLLLARSVPRLLVVLLPVGATALLLLLFGPGLPGRSEAALHWCLVAALLALFWWSVVLLVNSFRIGAETAALVLVGLWSLATLIAPTSIDAAAQFAHPPPSGFARIVASRHAEATATAGYENAHIGDNGEDVASVMKELRENAAIERQIERVLTPITVDHERRVREQGRVLRLLRYASPSLLAAEALGAVAGTDRDSQAGFKRQVIRYRAQLTAAVNHITAGARPLAVEDEARLPRFNQVIAADRDASAIVWLVTITIVLSGWSFIRFRRIEP